MATTTDKGLLTALDQYLEVALTADSKIYVTITVLSIVLISFFFYLIFTDKKISKVEEELETVLESMKNKQAQK